MYKPHHRMLSQMFHMFPKKSDIRDYDTRQSQLLHKPNTEFIKRSFRFQAVQLWNEFHLTIDIKK